MHRRYFEPVPVVAIAILAAATPNVAAATIVDMNEFAVTLGTAQIFDDSFNRNATLVGGSGTVLSSGTTFANGSPANYLVRGTINETTANNGQAVLNTANGVLISLPDPFIPSTLNVQAFLQTGSNLSPSTTFSAIGLFDLAVPAVQFGTYDVALSSGTLTTKGRELEMRIRETSSGPVLQFAWLDVAANLFTTIDQIPITPAELADPQVELKLSLNTANSDVITASYAFGSGNTLATFNGSLTALASTNSSTDVFTPTLDSVRSGFTAFDPVPGAVPEPSTWAMMLAGFAGLGFLGWRRHARAAFAD
jgi:hypothetical protein